MAAPIVIGVDDSDRALDAIALARALCAAGGAELVLVNAYPYDPVHGTVARPEYGRLVQEQSEALLTRHVAALADVPARGVAVADFSAARALQTVAEGERAGLIVVGPTHRGPIGQVVTGSVAERLLSGSPCPVALAPAGFRDAGRAIARVGVAYVATEGGRSALTVGVRVAERLGAALHVIGVADPSVWERDAWAGRATRDELAVALREVVQRHLDEAAAGLPGAEAERLDGDPATQLAERSRTLDLLVCGSRDYGPATAVLVGGVTKELMRMAACPVVVVPRAAVYH